MLCLYITKKKIIIPWVLGCFPSMKSAFSNDCKAMRGETLSDFPVTLIMSFRHNKRCCWKPKVVLNVFRYFSVSLCQKSRKPFCSYQKNLNVVCALMSFLYRHYSLDYYPSFDCMPSCLLLAHLSLSKEKANIPIAHQSQIIPLD